MNADSKPTVIILCTGNSCRSLLAEALWREEAGGSWQSFSAGTRPTGQPHPMALRVLEEDEIPTADLKSEGIGDYQGQKFDLAITVCASAGDECPVFPGAAKTLHWPFPDPADHVSVEDQSEEGLQIFRIAREAIRQRIQRYLASLRFEKSLLELIEQLPGDLDATRLAAYRNLVMASGGIMDQPDAWGQLPVVIEKEMQSLGWEWNGIYHLHGQTPNRRLQLGSAAGPPVCATLEEIPGERSGMCFDAVRHGRLLVAADVRSWPGYVSCDGESGLATVSSIVRPLLDENGEVVAVWDLDAVKPVHPCDALLMDALLEGFSAFGPPRTD